MNRTNNFHRVFAVLTAGLLLLSGACSPDPEMPDLPDISTIGSQAPVLQEAIDRNNKELVEISKEPYPPYYLNPGDVYSVQVYDNEELNVESTVITPDGYLSVGLIGPVKVQGLTVHETKKLIETKLSEYIKGPIVTVVPMQINSNLATVAGKVMRAGRFPVNGVMYLSDLIALAEGFPMAIDDGRSVELADFQSSVFVRGRKIIPVDFQKALRGEPLHNVRIRGGDYVFISTRMDKRVSVIGEVNDPQMVTWYANQGLIEVIARAGGLKAENPHSDNIVIIRGGMNNPELYKVALSEVLTGIKPNPALQPGDIVYIPKNGTEEYNVFIKKLMPTGQLINLYLTPGASLAGFVM